MHNRREMMPEASDKGQFAKKMPGASDKRKPITRTDAETPDKGSQQEHDADRHRTRIICKEDAVGQFTMMMPEASDKGSQPYSCPLGDCEMAGMGLPQ